MKADFYAGLQKQLDDLKKEGLYKSERVITSQQQADIKVTTGEEVLNFCANNYLGLANAPELIEEGKRALASAPLMNTATAWRLFVLSVVPRLCTSSWKSGCLNF